MKVIRKTGDGTRVDEVSGDITMSPTKEKGVELRYYTTPSRCNVPNYIKPEDVIAIVE